MVSYTQNELLSITEFTKSISKILGSLKENSLEKVGVLKNNKLEAVVITTDEYERLKAFEELIDVLEHKEIYDVVKQRAEISKDDFISIDEMAKKFDINISSI